MPPTDVDAHARVREARPVAKSVESVVVTVPLAALAHERPKGPGPMAETATMRSLPPVLAAIAVDHRPMPAAVEVLVILHPSVLKV